MIFSVDIVERKITVHFRGVYINLSTSVDRDVEMRRQLAVLGISDNYQRFDAISGAEAPERLQTALSHGHLGCWLSHQTIWLQARESNQHLHVIEDDAVFDHFLVETLGALDLDEESWDLLFTDVYFHPPPTPEQFARLRQWIQAFSETKKLTLASLGNLPFTGTSSYLVNRRSLDRLLGLVDGQWKLNRTFDVHLQSLVREGKIRALVMIPFLSRLGTCNLDSTTGDQGPALEVLNAFREALYYKANRDAIYAKIRPCVSTVDTEPLLGLYLELLRNVLGTLQVRK